MRMTPTTYGAFLSTLSLRRATGKLPKPLTDCVFLSTLSLRRATVVMEAIKVENQYFYPRSPCGERPKEAATTANTALFLSTLSLRRATPRSRDNSMGRNISIHALLAESDVCGCFHPDRQSPYFYPRSPCGERRQIDAVRLTGLYFYPRSPCGERQKPA